jgi:FSR family fosmidomycin resistance protein-like MFS transporter
VPANSVKFQTGKIMILSICHFIHDIYSGFLSPLLPLLIEKHALSLTRAGFLSTVMQIPHLLNPYIGLLADMISVRYFIILAPSMTAVPMSLLGLAPSYGVLLILFFITGVSVAVFHVPAPVIIARLSGNKTGRGMSFYMTGGELARAVSPLVAVGAVSLLGLEGFYPIMIVGIAASGWLYLKLRNVPVIVRPDAKISVSDTWKKMQFILLPLTAILLTRGFMHAAMTTFLPTFIKLETGNLWLAGIGLTIFEAAGVAGILTAGSLSDTLGRRRILLASLLSAPVCLMIFVLIDGWLRYLLLLLTGFTLLSTTPVMLALVQEHAKDSPSAANGLFMMASFVARSAIVVLVGFISDLIGLRATFVISAVMGFAGIPFILMLPRT